MKDLFSNDESSNRGSDCVVPRKGDQPATVAEKGPVRFYEIDLFRFLAALGVVFFHYTFRGHAAGGRCDVSYAWMGEIFKYGYLGVDLFFIISGFVILLTAMNRNATGFAVSRIVRLYPAFWAGMSLTALVTVFLGGDAYSVTLKQYFLNLPMVGGYFGVKPVDSVYWTLLVELKFYILIGLLLLLGKINHIKVFLGFWLSLSFAHLFLDFPGPVAWPLILRWAPYFIAGAFFYLIRREGVSLYKLAGVATAYGLSIQYAFLKVPRLEEHYGSDFSELPVFGLITLFYVMMFLVSINKAGALVRREWMMLGALTYPLYLVHQNAGFMVFNALAGTVPKYALLGLVIGLMLLVSYLINRYVEKRMAGPLKKTLLSITSRGSRSKASA
ncbi:MAG: acyltransferase [Pirellulales bacterium]|nr:acyltransferase [Pirellulales bacterium]